MQTTAEDYIGRVITPTRDPAETPKAQRVMKGTARRRFRLFNRFWRHPATAGLGNAERSVWCYLWGLADAHGLAFPSYARIAQRHGCSLRHAKRTIARLQAVGFLRLESRGSSQRKRANCYRLVLPASCDDDKDVP